MKQYYESEVLFQLMERDGLNIPSSVPPYEAEIKAYLINQVKQAYPKLTDYEAEWLLYNYTKHLPAEFPVSSVTDVTEATFENVVPFAYQSAILKGNTGYRDIDTGEFLETFEEGRNLELVSVKMPVLTTVGKNLFDLSKAQLGYVNSNGNINPGGKNNFCSDYFSIKPNTDYTFFKVGGHQSTLTFSYYDKNKNFISRNTTDTYSTSPSNAKFLIVHNQWVESGTVDFNDVKLMIVEGQVKPTTYEPHKSNILTVNEDVTLRSNGDICDELNLLTGQLTQRIDENGEVLSQEIVKTVELTTVNEKGETTHFMPLEGTMHLTTSSETINPLFSGEIPVEAITQNLATFIDLEMRNNNE